MKKQLLFTVMLMIMGSLSLMARPNHDGNGLMHTDRYRYAQPIMFIERGVEFMIFPDGSFEFADTNVRDYRRMSLQSNSRFSSATSPGRIGAVRYLRKTPRTHLSYNHYGEVIGINDILIDYDRQGKVRRIGSVKLNYQKGNNRLRQVGGLKVNFNRWGEIVHMKGHVNRYNAHLNRKFKSHRSEYFEIDDYDEDYYYYQRDGKRKKHKKKRR